MYINNCSYQLTHSYITLILTKGLKMLNTTKQVQVASTIKNATVKPVAKFCQLVQTLRTFLIF